MSVCLISGQRIAILLLLSAVLFSPGCGSFGKKHQADFLKPFASASSSTSRMQDQPMPSEHTLCVETAKAVAAQGYAVEAIKLYERAETLDPAAPSIDAELAALYASVGNHSTAIERYQRCVTRTPEDIELSNNFAWTLMEAGRFDQAISEANRGLQNDGDHARLQTTLAMIHYRQGDHAKALQRFETAHGSSAAHHNLSLLEIDSGNLDSAKGHLRVANQSAEPSSQSEALLTALQKQTTNH